MEWSEEDVTEVEKVQTRGQLTLTPARETLRQMMTRAVELAAARGGTMTAEHIENIKALVALCGRLPTVAFGTSEQANAAHVTFGYARDALCFVEEHIAAMGARVAALEAELERLKPSGQVAEDVQVLREFIDATLEVSPPEGKEQEVIPALVCLTAKAQGYEAAVADNAELLGLIREDTTCGKGGSCIECGWIGHHHADCKRGMAACGRGHPGAALLEEHRKALVRAKNEGLEKAASEAMSRADPGSDGAEELAALAYDLRAMKESEQ